MTTWNFDQSQIDIFPLRYPGSFLAGLPDEQSHRVSGLIHVLEGHLADGAMALALYTEARARAATPPPRWDPADPWHARRRELEAAAEAQLPPHLSPAERWAARERIQADAEWEVTSARAAAGEVPREYMHRLPLLYAHAFLYALDGIIKTLAVLADEPGLSPNIAQASVALEQSLSSVRGVRDSAHHLEDRARGLDRHRRPLNLQPIMNNAINAPRGGVVALGNLNRDLLGYTTADGSHQEVEISKGTLHLAQQAIQQVIDSLQWRGHSSMVPTYW